MKYLTLQKSNRNQPEVHTKSHYGGMRTNIETISKQRNILITGAHHSGKSRMVTRLFDDCEKIWFRQVRPYKYSRNTKLPHDKPMLKQGETLEDWKFPEPVMLNGITPLSKWVEHEGVKEWYERKHCDQEYKKVPAWKKVELIPDYLKDTRAILFIDDAHKLTGRKLQISKMCMDSAYRIIMATSDENRLSPNIRRQFLETKPQIVRLNSDVAYDATHMLMWTIIVMLMLAGMTEMAAILGVLETLKGGRRGSKQD